MSEAPVRVLPADLRDAADRDAFLTLLQGYARDPMGGGEPIPEEALARVAPGLLDLPTASVWLAWQDGEPVGLLTAFLGFSTFRGRPLLNVHDLAVQPDRRGRGIGEALLRAAEEHARKQGCCRLTLEVREHNTRARTLYARFGFGRPGDPERETFFLEKPLA